MVTTTGSIFTTTTTTNAALFEKDPIDLAVLSLLLAEHPQQNISLDFLQGHNHKSLFSDDEVRKNEANRFSFILIINFILFSILSIIL